MRWYTRQPFIGGTWWMTPPRCPVDDAPHTTCTSADYDDAAPPRRIVIQQLPQRDAQQLADRPLISAGPVVPLGPTEVTTATYRRANTRGKS
jgi:hypothetical protein